MARYNTIFAGPDSENLPQAEEAIASVDVLPGLLVTLTAGQFALGVAATATAIYVARENYLAHKSVDQATTAGNTLVANVPLDEQLFNLRFATGINVTKGAAIGLGAAGRPVLAAAGARVIGYADETFNNNTGSDQLIRVRAVAGYRLAA